MKLYHNPRCSKSRQGLDLLKSAGQDFEVVEYLKDSLSISELTDVVKKLGIPAEKLVRKGEADFKENYKGKELSEEQWIEAMIAYPKLIQRPILVKGNRAALGRPLDDIEALLNS